MSLETPTLWILSWTVLYSAGLFAPLVGHFFGGKRWSERSTDVSILLALLGSLVGVAGAAAALISPASWAKTVDVVRILKPIWSRGYLPPVILQVKVDPLAAGFTLLIAAFAAVVSIYSFDALRAPHFLRQRAWIAGAFNVFVWATLMVVVVNDLFSLMVVLEIMTLAFGCLTLYKQNLYQEPQGHDPGPEKRKDARLAPQVYMIVSHTSTAFLLLAVLLLVRKSGSFSFDDLRQFAGPSTAIFLLALAGLGIRAGLTPAHFWVSLVHPSSPTTTHAFSLGIAIKIAVYLMIRFFFQFLTPQVWWGYLLLALAVVTAVVNVWYAISSHDLKKALAYHSVENVGIIVAGVGAALIYQASALLYQSSELSAFAVLAMTAGLYHILNHAVFKGLLYLDTGAIERQTNQNVDIERLGGLLNIWPWTSLTFLIGAVSIAGFPPFNGFISEWLILQALLGGSQSSKLSLAQTLPLVLSIAFLFASFALTAFCFVKITGLALLGKPRSNPEVVAQWQDKPDVPWFMRGAMVVLASLCLIIGLFPMGIFSVLSQISESALGHREAVPVSQLGFDFHAGLLTAARPAPAMVSIFVVACLLGLGALLISRVRLRGRSKSVEASDPWNCGTPFSTPRTKYTGAALSFLIRDLFGAGWAPTSQSMPPDYLPANLLMSEGAANVQPRARQVVVETFRVAYNRLIDWLLRNSKRVETTFQNGDLRRYLLYIMIANLVVLSLFLLSSLLSGTR